ncbi:hypothetical protein AGMMS49983_15160 [Clostridia bacterium]|nr:hypothetical protein AGMMS49983_15160 [Clostridia bacterium]
MSDTNNSTVMVEMTKQKRTVFVIGTMLLFAGFAASNFASGVAMPAKLTAIGGMDYYALCGVLGALGIMLSLPLVGKLSEIFGGKAVVIFGIIFQFATRFAIAFITDVNGFMVLYLLTSIGAGLIASAPFAFIANVFPREECPKYYGLLTTFRAVGSLAGPLLAGVMNDMGYVNFAFIAYIPFTIISIPIILILFPNIKTKQTAGTKFDVGGIILLVVGLSGIVLWLSLSGKNFSWISIPSIALLVVGVLALFFLVRVESKHPNPTVPILMFKKRRFTIAFLCMMLVSAFTTSSASFAIAYAQGVMQVSSTLSGTITMPQTIVQLALGTVIGVFLSSSFAKRFRPLAILSLILVVVASFALYFLTPTSSMALIYFSTGVGGLGMIVPIAAFTPFFQSELQPQEIASAMAMYSFGASGGSTIFGSIAGAVMNSGGSFNSVFLLGAVFCMIALVIGVFGFRPLTKK